MRAAAILFGSLFAIVHPALGAIYKQHSELSTLEFDYIIVGGGTAGNVVANRLSEDSSVSVLVLEAGGSNEGVLPAIIPAFAPLTAPNTPYDWNYTTVPQIGLGTRTVPYPRGHILGGTSSINYMTYNRGSRDDFDGYAKIAGVPEWSWDSIIKCSASKNEKFIPPSKGNDNREKYVPLAHFKTGEVSISLSEYSWPMDRRAIAITNEFPDIFPYQEDVNAGNPIGISWVQGSIGNGERSSSATAYLAPKHIARPNLHVLLHAHVTKLVKTGVREGLPLFGAVEFAVSASSPIQRVNARKEVILSAGSFNSPQLLLLSGIGDKAELAKVGIDSVLHLPDVGKNGSDHLILPSVINVDANDTFERHIMPEVIGSEIARWNQTRKGPLASTAVNVMGWLRLPEDDPVIKKYGDPAAGPTSSHYEIIFAPTFAIPDVSTFSNETLNTIFSALISPTSRGTISLKTSNPFDAPLIDPNFLTTETDLHIMVESVKAVKKIAESESWKGYFKGYWGDIANANTDQEIIKYVRNTASSLYHFVGTAGMSRRGADYGVVDPDLRVKGAAGLRVVDASVFPYIPTAHTQIEGPVYLVAELASAFIKAQAKESPSEYWNKYSPQHLYQVFLEGLMTNNSLTKLLE